MKVEYLISLSIRSCFRREPLSTEQGEKGSDNDAEGMVTSCDISQQTEQDPAENCGKMEGERGCN